MTANAVKIVAAVDVLTALARAMIDVSEVIREAREDGRETLTAGEWADILATNDEARAELAQAIRDAAGGRG
jgi:Na+-transporting methylmalonyl-CoA/oxaloacetate decarboxylase gamma subunit